MDNHNPQSKFLLKWYHQFQNMSSAGRGPPSTLDLSEFPSLSGGNLGDSLFSSNSVRPPYVGMVKDNVPTSSASQEFTILSEDFPALPGSNNTNNSTVNSNSLTNSNAQSHAGHEAVKRNQSNSGLGGIIGTSSVTSPTNQPSSGLPGSLSSVCSSPNESSLVGNLTSNKQLKRGIQTSKDGRVTNIPPGMVADQFGMVGLLTFIRAAESDPSLVSLALGIDLGTLKLDLNSTENLYSTFAGPWSDQPLKPHEMDYPVPHEYLINNQVKEKLQPIKLDRYGEDILFLLFYMFPNDLIQLAAANELYSRDWRYHKDEKVWITRAPGMPPIEKQSNYERGTYFFFDALNWRKVAKEFHLDYNRLENRPPASTFNHVTLMGQQPRTTNLVSL